MLKIWGRKNAVHVQEVLQAGSESGLSFEGVDAGMAFGVNNTPESKQVNESDRLGADHHA